MNPRQDKVIDFSKQMVTICTGTLGLLVTFFEELAGSPDNPRDSTWLIKGAILALLISLASFLVCHAFLALTYDDQGNHKRWTFQGGAFLLGAVSFFAGILSLGVFSFNNIP